MIGKGGLRKVFAIYDGDKFLDVGTAKELSEKWGIGADYIRSCDYKSIKDRMEKAKKPWGKRIYYVFDEPIPVNERIRDYAWRKNMWNEKDIEKHGMSDYLMGKSKCFLDIVEATKEHDIAEEGIAKINDWSEAYGGYSGGDFFELGYRDAMREVKTRLCAYKREEEEWYEAKKDSDAI